MTPNSRLIQNKQRKRSNSAAPSYHDTSSDSESHSDHQSRRGFISRLLPNSKVNTEHPLLNEYKASSTGSLNKTGNGFGKLFKRIGGTKAHPDMEDVPKVRPIRHPQQHSKIPLAPPPRRRASSHVSSQFLTELPDQYIVKPSPSQQQQQPLAISSSDSIYSTFAGSDSFESDDEFVDADEFSQEDIDLLERKLALSKRLSGGHFGSAGGLVVCIQPDTLKIPQDHELGQSMINWKRVSGNKRWSQITMIDRRQSVATVVNMKSDEEIRKETEDMLTGQIQKEEMFASDVWTSSSYDISLQVQDEEKEDGEEEEEDGEEKAKRTAYELWKGEDESVTSREKMAEWLGQGKPFNARVLEHYMQRFDFSEMRLESAFRKLCSHLYFKAEAQQIDRILEVFANHYWECNTTCLLGSADVVYAVVYSLLLLNTDLHVAQGKHVRMTRSEFVRNTMSTVLEQEEEKADGWEMEVENYLKEMYMSVKQFQILQPLAGKTNLAKRTSILGNRRVVGLKRGMNSIIRKSGIIEPTAEELVTRKESFSSVGSSISSQSMSQAYCKQGVVIRKHLLESGTQKARHREWRECYLEVGKSGELCMYQLAEADKRQSVSDGALGAGDTCIGQVSLNHTLSNPLPPPGYNRQRPHVFAIQQSDGGVYLFQTSSAKETQEWVSACNYWAARTSKEPLPGGVSNMEYGWGPCLDNQKSVTIHDWIPPTATMVSSQLNEKEQYQVLQKFLDELNNEINQHRDTKTKILNKFPIKSSHHTQVITNWEARAKYLLHEIIKYQNYCDAIEKSIERIDQAEKLNYPTMQVDLFKEIDQELHFNL